jgi:uncharacterized membrane protein YgaE (UPF0421/DUF939 family)
VGALGGRADRGGLALVFSQLLFVPEPVRLLRRAESAVLSSLADGLRRAADALEHKNHHLADQATGQLRALRDNLVTLNTVRTACASIVRHSLTWRMRVAPVAREQQRADQLDLLAGSGVMLARTAMATTRSGASPTSAGSTTSSECPH